MIFISVMFLSFNILLKGSICCASVVNNTNQHMLKFGYWFPELDSGMLGQLIGFLNSLNRFSVCFVLCRTIGVQQINVVHQQKVLVSDGICFIFSSEQHCQQSQPVRPAKNQFGPA